MSTAGSPAAQDRDRRRLRSVAHRALRTAARAPSAHNTQPWVPHIPDADPGPHDPGPHDPGPASLTVTVGIDPERTLPHSDVHHVDTLLGIGCWVEAYALACADEGVSVRIADLTGCGAQTVATLLLTPALRSGQRHPSPPTLLTGRDVRARQVDRGRLTAPGRALDAALTEFRGQEAERPPDLHAAVPPALRIVQVPDRMWRELAAHTLLYVSENAQMLRETVRWLRFDPSDPRWYRDGLTAECLRLNGAFALTVSRLMHSAFGRTLISGAGLWHRPLSGAQTLLAATVRAVSSRGRTAAKAPARGPVGLVLGTSAASVDQVPAADWIELGRSLLRLWLILDRHGIRVAVSSQLKDAPASAEALAALLGRQDSPGDGTWIPFAAFTAGRSAGPVPRSHRLPAG